MITDLIRTKEIILCVGSGGVGKTTTSASIALQAAASGRKVLVLTVDPAKRLANSLGLDQLSNEPTQIKKSLLQSVNADRSGELWALMLDTKETFDDLITANAPDAETRDRLLNSIFYEKASTALAGTHEFMAMEKLYEIYGAGTYDLIVLDTPPTTHALDFLRAPNKLVNLLDNRSFRVMMDYSRSFGRLGFRLFNRNSYILKGISKFIGLDFLLDLLTFLDSFNAMYDGFQRRARTVQKLLASDEASFFIVCAPEPMSIDEGVFFHNLLKSKRMPFGCFIVNRTHHWPPFDESGLTVALKERLGTDDGQALLVDKVVRIYSDYQELAAVDTRCVEDLAQRTKSKAVYTVPIFDKDIHDIATLYQFAQHLCGAAVVSSDSAEESATATP